MFMIGKWEDRSEGERIIKVLIDSTHQNTATDVKKYILEQVCNDNATVDEMGKYRLSTKDFYPFFTNPPVTIKSKTKDGTKIYYEIFETKGA